MNNYSPNDPKHQPNSDFLTHDSQVSSPNVKEEQRVKRNDESILKGNRAGFEKDIKDNFPDTLNEDENSNPEDDEEESSDNESDCKKSLMKPKSGGVNGGLSKKQANALKGGKNQKNTESQSEKQTRRTKERTITDIIEKVSTWRKLYNGVTVKHPVTGQVTLQRWSLEDAAEKVGVSKKSLDDYLLQLRFGKKFQFDFELNRDKKVGVLRSFVKEMKEKEKEQNKNVEEPKKKRGK